MTLDDVIRKGTDALFEAADVDAFCAEHGMSFQQFSDKIAEEIVRRYSRGALSFEFADTVMNHVFALASVTGRQPLPPFAESVFLAFDAGEYHHPEDPPGSSPEELHTKPQIAEILASGKPVT